MTVDSSIVVLENVFRYRERGGAKLHAAAILGTKEMIVSIVASTLTTVCVFVPMVLLRSNLEMLGEMITPPMAGTIIISLLASLIVSITLIPVLSSSYVKIYTRKQKPLRLRVLRYIDDKAEDAFEALDRGYKRVLALLIDYRWLTLILVVLIMVLTFQAYGAMHQSLYPTMSETSVTVSATLPEGTTLETTENLLRDLEAKAKQDIVGYKDLIVTVGGGGMFGGGGTNSGSLQISLNDDETADTMQKVQEKLRQYFPLYPSASFSFSQMSMGLGNINPVDVVVKSDNLDLAVSTAEQIRDLIEENLPGVTEVRTDFTQGLPEFRVVIDRERAYAYNLTMQSIANEISYSVNGLTATQLKSDGSETDVVVILQDEDRSSELDLRRIFVRNSMGEKISLDNIASIERATGPVSINRENEMRTVHVVGGLAGSYAVSQAEEDIKALVKEQIQPSGEVFIEYGGDFADMTQMFSQVWLILVLAIVLVFGGVMASLFESFRNPFIVLLSMPLMLIGVVGIYLITGETFSLISAIGLIILAGIVVNNGIVLIEYINLLRRRGQDIRTACIEAGGNRLKPILMTSLTTIFGMIPPLAFFGGQGAEQIQPIGQTIIGGMTISTLMTIFFTPVLYALFNREKRKQDVESIENYAEGE